MSTVVLGLRLLLALVFTAAAGGKLADRAGSVQALRDFGLPEGALGPGAIVLPLGELAIAIGVVVTASARIAAACAVALLAAFVAAIGRAMARGESPDCHCFGQLHSEPAGAATLARNAVLAAAAIVVVATGPGRSVANLTGKDLALVLTSLAAITMALISIALWRENQTLRSRPGPRRMPFVTGLPTGMPAPDVPLITLDGATVSLGDILGSGRPTALVQVSPKCGPCRALMPELSRWQEQLERQLAVVAISTGDPGDNRAFAEEHGLRTLYLESELRVGDAYHVKPTPSAVLIDENGKIAAAPATGAPAIEALIRLGLSRLSTPAY
jgi:methylamine dehydrogenase accessory protein MauD